MVKAGYSVDVDDRRPPFDPSLFPERVAADYPSDRVWPVGHERAGEPIALRDYQVDLINTLLANPQAIHHASTGAGKTLTAACLMRLCEPYGRTLTVVPSKSLVTQTEKDFVALGLDTGVFFGDRKETGRRHTIGTWQSFGALAKRTREELVAEGDGIHDVLDGLGAVLIDECFDGDTPVLTNRGWRAIRHILPGDRVINWSETAKSFKTDVVEKTHRNLAANAKERMYELEFDVGVRVRVTGNHRFLTERGWVRADRLTSDDAIVSRPPPTRKARTSAARMAGEFNRRLAECGAAIRVISYDAREAVLSNGTRLDRAGILLFRRRLKGQLAFAMDALYGADAEAAAAALQDAHRAGCRRGAETMLERHRDKLVRQGSANLARARSQPHPSVGRDPWNKGLTKHSSAALQRLSRLHSGDGNPIHRRGGWSEAERATQSERMRTLIARGAFTPNPNNSRCKRWLSFNGKNYRSSWEVVFAATHPSCAFETLRIPYTDHEGRQRTYIVDFVDHERRQAFEIKPRENFDTPNAAAKLDALRRWAAVEGYDVILVDDEVIGALAHSLDLDTPDFGSLTSEMKRNLRRLHAAC